MNLTIRLFNSCLVQLAIYSFPICCFGQLNDSILTASVQIKYRPWFFTKKEDLKEETKVYSNGQIYTEYAFLNDSMLICQSTFHKNGKLASKHELLAPECIQWTNNKGIVSVQSPIIEKYESFYINGAIRAYQLKLDKSHSYSAFDKEGNEVYSESIVSGDTISGFFCSEWMRGGLLFKYYVNHELIYLVECDILNKIKLIRNKEGEILNSLELKSKFEQIIGFVYDGSDW